MLILYFFKKKSSLCLFLMKWKYKTSGKIKISKESLVIFREHICMEHAIVWPC